MTFNHFNRRLQVYLAMALMPDLGRPGSGGWCYGLRHLRGEPVTGVFAYAVEIDVELPIVCYRITHASTV